MTIWPLRRPGRGAARTRVHGRCQAGELHDHDPGLEREQQSLNESTPGRRSILVDVRRWEGTHFEGFELAEKGEKEGLLPRLLFR